MAVSNDITYALPFGTYLQQGKYRVEKVLGQGSFGITYLASVNLTGEFGITPTGIKVAVKEFFMKDVNGRSGKNVTVSNKEGIFQHYKSRFIKEAQTLHTLKHPNIVHVIDLFEENNTAYYVMDYLPGGSLDSLISQHAQLSVADASPYIFQVTDALAYMHGNKMLHLDLKPSNVMIDKEGHAVIIDFGLTKQFKENGQPESSTTIGAGTPGYAPIEQANYKPEQTDGFPATIDVYALGATFFKMLTGHRPPDASEILNDGFPKEELTEKSVPDDIVDLIEMAMMPMKKQRIQSVEEFVGLFPMEYAGASRTKYAFSDSKENVLKNEDTVIPSAIDIKEDTDKTIAAIKDDDTDTDPGTDIDPATVTKVKVEKQYFRIDPAADVVRISVKSGVVFGSYDVEVSLKHPAKMDPKILYIFGKPNFEKFVNAFNKLNLLRTPEKRPLQSGDKGNSLEITCYGKGAVIAKADIYEKDNQVYGCLGSNYSSVKRRIEKQIPSLERHLRDVRLPSEYDERDFSRNIGNISFMLKFPNKIEYSGSVYLQIEITRGAIKAYKGFKNENIIVKKIDDVEYEYFLDNLFEYLKTSADIKLSSSNSFLHLRSKDGGELTPFSYYPNRYNYYMSKDVLKECFNMIPYIDAIMNHFNIYPDWEKLH